MVTDTNSHTIKGSVLHSLGYLSHTLVHEHIAQIQDMLLE